MKRIILGLVGIVLSCCASSQANILVSFNFDNSTGAADTVATGLAATPFTSAIGSPGWVNHSSNGKAIGAVGFLTSGNYFTFTLTVNPGYQLRIDSLYLENAKQGGMNGKHWQADHRVGSDGLFTHGPTGNIDNNNGWLASDNSVSGLANLQNTTVTFHFAPTDASNNDKNWYLDNVALSGTVTAIPEPATIALLGLGAMALIRSRKK